MVAIVTTGDARALPFPDDSIDLIVTSPPYYQLRRYAASTDRRTVPIGEEADWREYLTSLLDCTREMARVIKPTGSIFVNLGDRYSGAQAQNGTGLHVPGCMLRDNAAVRRTATPARTGIPRKSLMLLPERYRIACVDELGLIARAVVVWEKPNGLPESVRDRVRRSHEDWVHLTKSTHYHQSVDEIREPFATTHRRPRCPHPPVPGGNRGLNTGFAPKVTYLGHSALGRLPGSVWTIPTQPLRVPARLPNHFAAFPTEWPRRLISGWCPARVCTSCGKGRPSVPPANGAGGNGDGPWTGRTSRTVSGLGTHRARRERRLACRASNPAVHPAVCICIDTGGPTRPGVVLDVFGGSGTTALVADVLGRVGISLDASPDYVSTAQWRTTDDKQRTRIHSTPRKNSPPSNEKDQ